MRRLRDVDSAERAFRLKAYGWSLGLGAIGAVAGYALAIRTGRAPLLPMILGFALGTLISGFAASTLAELVARIGRRLYLPSGSSTPATREYSLADALAARGRFFDAADELQRCAALYPQDPEPKLRLARLYRDQLQQPEDAVAWFRRVLDTPGLAAPAEQAVLRELVEVFTHRLRRPRAAAPWLARLAERHGDTPAGQWAKRELAEIKRELFEE